MGRWILFLLILLCMLEDGFAQKGHPWIKNHSNTLLLEKIGTHHRYSYIPGDNIKLQTRKHAWIDGELWDIDDSVITVGQGKPIHFIDINSVYPQFEFLKKFGTYISFAGIVYFSVVSLNHLINNEKVFTNDTFIVPACCFGAGFISISFSQKRCKIGPRWKLKVLDIRVF
jgi:hypothetical protein